MLPAGGPPADPLVGRADERAAVRSALDDAAAGAGCLLLVDGEAGVGKTALVDSVLADRDGVPLRAAGRPGPAAGAAMLTRLLRSTGRADPAPVASVPVSSAPVPSAPDGDPARLVAEALTTGASSEVAGSPLVVVLDDLQWADPASLDLLPLLAEELAGQPVAVIGCYRTEEIGRDHPLRTVRARLRRTGLLREVGLGPLPEPAMRALIGRLLPGATEPILATILARAEGVPFFAEQLAADAARIADRITARIAARTAATGDRVTAGPDPVPEPIRDAVLLRTATLDEEERAALEAAAVLAGLPDIAIDIDIGSGTETDGTGRAWFAITVAEDLVGPALMDQLVDHGLLLVDGERAAFRRRLVGQAVYAGLPDVRRRELHRQVALRLQAAGAPAAEVAGHAVAARDVALAGAALLAGADQQIRAHAHRDAVRALRAALAWFPPEPDPADQTGPNDRPDHTDRADPTDEMPVGRGAVLDRLAGCLEHTGDLAEALPLLFELAGRHRARGDRLGEARVQQRIARAGEMLADWSLALAAREDAAVRFATAGRPGSAALERLAAAAHLRSAGSFAAALPVLTAARADAVRAGDPALIARVDALHGNVLCRAGRPGGVQQVTQALDLALAHGLTSAAAEIQQRLGDCLEHTGDYTGAQQAYAAAVDYCQLHGEDTTEQLCRACAGYVLFQRGDWDRAVEVARDILAAPDGSGHVRSAAASVLGLVLVLRGRTGAARPHLLEAAATAHRVDVLAPQILAGWGLAVLADQHAGPSRAIAAARGLLAIGEDGEESHYSIPSMQWAVTMFARHDSLPEARRACARLAGIAEAVGHPEALAAWSHALAEVAASEGDRSAALDGYRRALELQQGVPMAFPSALLASRAAAALRVAGRPVEAIDLLRSARRTAHRLRAMPLLGSIDDDLRALGEPPATRRRTAGDPPPSAAAPGLTEREAEVMALVAAGHTSRQIAGLLFLSVRTVDMHVRNCMIKLDCRTRAQAVTRFSAATGSPRPT
jgi:DNA-binding CsgD family transcriptional regulator/tetratricopeptide (TPR) repeat protein